MNFARNNLESYHSINFNILVNKDIANRHIK